MTLPFESAIVRIQANDGTVVGAGFLVTEQHILTCVHVVTRALDLPHDVSGPPRANLHLDFPLLTPGLILTARVGHWQPVADVAGLELIGKPPPGGESTRLVTADDLWGHSFRAFGFPAGYEQGVWVSGVLRSRQADGWLQIEDTKGTGYLIAPGFSGGPVWDDDLDGVVGMIVAADTSETVKAAFLIPADVLVKTWPDVIRAYHERPASAQAAGKPPRGGGPGGVTIGDVTGGIHGSIIAGGGVSDVTVPLGGQPPPVDRAPAIDERGGVQTGGGVSREDVSERTHLARLRQILASRFAEGELRTICFDLGVDYDSLPGVGKADKAREIVAYLERREQIHELVRIGRRQRPDIPWEAVFKVT
jgi:S1-C subfamily serine protease